MIYSKNLDGFTLIETLLAAAIMGIILTPIFISQSFIMQSVGSVSSRYQRIMSAKNYLITARKNELEEKTTGAKTIEIPATTLTYQKEKLSGRLAKSYKDIYKEKVLIEWTENNQKRVDALTSFIFTPKKKEDKKA